MQTKASGPWKNEALVVALKTLWASGYSASIIADRLSGILRKKISRNAVIGKAYRMGLIASFKGGSGSQSWRAKNGLSAKHMGGKPGRRNKLNVLTETAPGRREFLGEKIRKPLAIEQEPYVVRTDIPHPVARKQLADLADDECRFPVGHLGEPDFGFCAQSPRVMGKPYCETCCQRAYQTVNPDRKKAPAPASVPEFEPA